SFVSCMHKMSGRAWASHSSTRGKRAFSELTFQVAIRTPFLLVAHPVLVRLQRVVGVLLDAGERLADGHLLEDDRLQPAADRIAELLVRTDGGAALLGVRRGELVVRDPE